MKLLAASSFETRQPFGGVIPVLPPSSGPDRGALKTEIAAVARAELFPIGPEGTRGTYWTGKSLEKLALLVWLADQIGEAGLRDGLVRGIAGELERWLDGKAPEAFAYEPTWKTLVGVPQEYRSGWELNDHHFHYGYFVFAAATVARFDPGWAARDRWGAMIDLLIKDAANPDRRDTRFPFLRHFDPYAGHSWANGPALFREGNNEESSSEDVNFATATLLWGAFTGDRTLRDLGIFLHTQLTAAVEQYWFDVDGRNFPKGFDQPALGILWGSGGKYDTWWDRNPVYVHGINFLPFTGGSLYLGETRSTWRRTTGASSPSTAARCAVARHRLDVPRPRRCRPGGLAVRKEPHLRTRAGQFDGLPLPLDLLPARARPRGAGDHRRRAHLRGLPPGRPPHPRRAQRRPPGARVKFSDGVSLEVPPGELKTVESEAR
jgi:endoglucanase Acf2